MTKKIPVAMREKQQKHGKLSFYPLRFREVISDVLKVKPEPKPAKGKAQRHSKQRGA